MTVTYGRNGGATILEGGNHDAVMEAHINRRGVVTVWHRIGTAEDAVRSRTRQHNLRPGWRAPGRSPPRADRLKLTPGVNDAQASRDAVHDR